LKDAYNRPGRASSGFTLLEVMIAVAIISGVVMTIITSLNFHLGVMERERARLTATFLARQKYEETKLYGPPPTGKAKGGFSEDYEGFSWEYASEDSLLPGVKRVLVSVLWGDGESVDIESYEESL